MKSVVMTCAVAALGVMTLSAPAGAQIEIYTAVLSGAAESPPNGSPGTGFATVTFDLTLSTMRVEATFSGLTGTTTAAHTHGPTAVPGAGTAGVMTMTPSYAGFPLGVTAGSMDTTFDMTLTSSFNGTFVTNNGGTAASAFLALLNAHRDGRAYFNVHSSTFGGGEIRGFLIPGPGATAFLAVGGLMAVRRRRG